MVSLFVKPPRTAGYHVDLEAERITLGRSAMADVRLPEDLSLSRQHAEIRRDGAALTVRDLGSRNGTFVNGAPVPAAGMRVAAGDTVSIGETNITIEPSSAARVEIGYDGGPQESSGTLILRMEDLLDRRPGDGEPGAPGDEVDARLLARFGRHMAMFEAVNEAGNLLRADRPLAELLEAILAQIFEMIPVERGAIVLREGERLVPKATRHRDPTHAADPIQIARGIADLALEERAAVSTMDAQSDPRFAERASIRMAGIRSAVCAPLYTGKEVLGLLYVDTLVAERSLGWDDLTLLSTLAVLTALKVENHQLLRAFLEKERLERELEIAKEISDHLLPKAVPNVAGIEVFARNVPCRSIGGDYYDVLHDGPWLHVVIADVCGKGIPAALLMASLAASFRAYVAEALAPAALLARLNETLVRTTPANKYATVFYARMNVATGEIAYANAGHNPPLLLRRAGGSEELATGGMICGMFEAAAYEEGRTRLDGGDLLLCYTDGFPDEESPDGEQLGVARLVAWIDENRKEPLPELGARLFDNLDGWCGRPDHVDDRTLLLLTREEKR